MREWDRLLLSRYQPRYHAVNSSCALCALGPCDLGNNRRGACGQGLEVFLAREALLMAVMGTSAHAAHARSLIERLAETHGPDLSLDLGQWIQIRLPITRTFTGKNPRRLGDLLPILTEIDSELVRLMSSIHFGGESDAFDLESKTLQAGSLDLVCLEIADVSQIAAWDFPRGEADTPLVRMGERALGPEIPLILCVGHHSEVGHEILHEIEGRGLDGRIEVAGLCCNAHDTARAHPHAARIIGNLRDQLIIARSGLASVIVADQQCIRLDLRDEALRSGAYFIATSDQAMSGLPDETARALRGLETPETLESLAAELQSRSLPAAYVADPKAAARLALALAEQGRPTGYRETGCPEAAHEAVPSGPAAPSPAALDPWTAATRCTSCGLCTEHCPLKLEASEAVSAYAASISGVGPAGLPSPASDPIAALAALHRRCLDCGKCNSACPEGIPVMELLAAAELRWLSAGASVAASLNTGLVRAGRGPIEDYEIKSTGPSIVLGDIPGMVAFLTCPEYPDGRDAVAWMARILARRGYIVLAAGCAAIDLGRGPDDQNPYAGFSGAFDQGGVLNTGSCVSSSHAIGAAIKVAGIFLHRPLDGNFEEIADYILNRVGCCAMLWGGITPKSFAAATGANRLGIPAVFGPQGKKFRRTLEGDPAAVNQVLDSRTGRSVPTGGIPFDLCATAGTREEALLAAVRLCFRANDTAGGRRTKLGHYLELSETLLGRLPGDLPRLVRTRYDLPPDRAPELLRLLDSQNWRPTVIPDPTLLQRMVRGRMAQA